MSVTTMSESCKSIALLNFLKSVGGGRLKDTQAPAVATTTMDECVMGTWKDGIYSGEIGRGENKAEGLYPVGRGGIGEWKMVRSRQI